MFWFIICCLAISRSVLSLSFPALPCNQNDKKCITSLSQQMYDALFVGTELDHMFQKRIEITLPTLAMTLTNTTTEGFKRCEVKDASISPDRSSIAYSLFCPSFLLFGQYDVDGTIDKLPLRGHGKFTVETTDYLITMVSNMEYTFKDGKKYLQVTDSHAEEELKGNLNFRLENLFDGNKELSAAAHKFIDDNQKLVAQLLQQPIFDANLGEIVKAYNALFVNIPVDGYLT